MQEENKFSYRSLNQSKEKEWHFARGLNDITTAGNYAVRLYHDDLEAIGISTAECDTEHYVVAHLVVIESAATGKQQKMRTVGQTLMFTTCTNQSMKIITRICVLTPDGVVWHPWVDSKAGTDYLPTAQELNTTAGHLDNKFVYKGTNDVDIVSGGYFDKTANDITLNLKKWGDTAGLGRARHTIAAATEAMAGVMSAEDKKKLNKAEVVTKVEWGVNSTINDYTSAGVYYITGKRSMSDDGLPIDTYPYFTARLLVVGSTENSNIITQILSLNASGESNLFMRNCVLGDTPVWSKWGKLQQNTNVGRVASLDNFTAGGVYSGIYTGGTSHETFVLTVINNEAAATAAGSVRCISQFKYALDLHSNYSYKTRTGRGDSVIEWGEWVDLVAADTTDIQDGAITAQKLSTALQEQINQNTANATKAANGAYWTSGPNAVTLNINKNDGTVGWQTLPAATTETAGVMSAGDKKKLDTSIVILKGFASIWYELSSWGEGESYYDIDDKVIKTSGKVSDGTVVNWASESQPTLNTIYVCGSTIYVWDSNDLIAVANTEDLKKVSYKNEQIEIEQGTINAGGGDDYSTTRIRTTTKFRAIGTSVLFNISNTEYKFRVFTYNSDCTFVKYTEYTDTAKIGLDEGQYVRVAFLRVDDGEISVEDYDEIGFKYYDAIIDTYVFSDEVEDALDKYIFKNTAYSTCNLNGKNVAFIGDSITASGSPSTQDNMYHAVFSRLTGCNVKNLGSWNTTIARDVDNLTDTAQPFITSVTEENLADCDMVVVFGGINDFAHDNNPIGEAFTETETDGIKQLVPNSDTRCFSGAMHELIQGIRSIVPLAPIVFMTPLMGYRSNDIRINSIANAHGDYLEDFRKRINEICSFYMVPVFNIDKVFNYDPNNTEQRAAFFADGLHPNDAGHIHIGKLLYQFVMQNIVM